MHNVCHRGRGHCKVDKQLLPLPAITQDKRLRQNWQKTNVAPETWTSAGVGIPARFASWYIMPTASRKYAVTGAEVERGVAYVQEVVPASAEGFVPSASLRL